MTYKFYKAQVTGAGYVPEGGCLATLTLDEERNPTWEDVSEEFQQVCMPWFGHTVRMGKVGDPEPLKPYSEEAIEHISKHQLPSQGYCMMTVKAPPTAPKPFQPMPFQQYTAMPPGLIKSHKPLD